MSHGKNGEQSHRSHSHDQSVDQSETPGLPSRGSQGQSDVYGVGYASVNGFSGLVHEETHPCGSNFIQSVFKTVQTRCIDSVLIQIVPFVNNTI